MLYRTDTLLPSSLSLPSKFSTFRPAQLEMAEFALYGKLGFQPDAGYTGFGEAGDPRRRFVAIGAPGGIGKTLASAAIGQLSGVKYGVITATRALEDQFLKDGFPLAHVRDRKSVV